MDNNNQLPEAYPLDETAIAMINELKEQMKPFQIAVNAILTYFVRQHKLAGNWQVADNGRELVQQAPQQQIRP